MSARSPKNRKLLVYGSVFLLCIAVFALLLSLGMPGVGWVVAMVALTGCSLIAPFIGRRFLVMGLIVSVIHLLTFGPLTMLGGGAVRTWPPLYFLLGFVIFPLVLALASLVVSGRSTDQR